MTIQHDITHCTGEHCSLKPICFRYQMHLDLKENPTKHGMFHSYFSPTVTDGTCRWFWDIQKMEEEK